MVISSSLLERRLTSFAYAAMRYAMLI